MVRYLFSLVRYFSSGLRYFSHTYYRPFIVPLQHYYLLVSYKDSIVPIGVFKRNRYLNLNFLFGRT